MNPEQSRRFRLLKFPQPEPTPAVPLSVPHITPHLDAVSATALQAFEDLAKHQPKLIKILERSCHYWIYGRR